MSIENAVYAAVIGLAVCSAIVLERKAKSKRIEKLDKNIEQLDKQLVNARRDRDELQANHDASKALQKQQAFNVDDIISSIPERTVKHLRPIAAMLVALESPEDEAKVRPVYELIFNSKEVDLREKLKAIGVSIGELKHLQFILLVVNAIIHSVNEPNPVTTFKERLAHSNALSTIVAEFSDEDQLELPATLARLRTTGWMAEYLQFVDAFEEWILVAEKK